MIQGLEEKLKEHFGYNEFRPNQRAIIEACLEGKDVLAVLPTGAGKSICYQLPAMILPGLTVVISPLISLMQDQVVSLTKNGLSAGFLNSSLTADDARRLMNDLGDYKMLYVAPERFAVGEFLEKLKQVPIALFAIDEAHCISQWGHSFRPDYRQLSLLKKEFPKTAVMALTATATREVERDIAGQLKLQNPYMVRASFDRPNLTIRIDPKDQVEKQVLRFLKKHPNESGILYGATRKSVDEMHLSLRKNGFEAGKYHAGLSDEERKEAQHQFIYGKTQVMVATVAFGMGIHKPDIRFILHLDMPRSVEQYYQEVGRAGRDGLPAECLMLYSAQELRIYDLFLDKIEDEVVRRQTKEKTGKIYSLCLSSVCRRKEILRYFGEVYPKNECEGCDRCLDEGDLVDISVAAQKILSCVYRLEGKYGVKYLIEVLRGEKIKAIFDRGHDRLSTYGLMKEESEGDLRRMIVALIEKGHLARTEGDYPVVQWSESSRSVVKGEIKVSMRKKTEEKGSVKKGASVDLNYNQHLFGELSQIRKKFAEEAKVPAFVVFGDRSLIEMCRYYPRTEDDFLEINGVSEGKLMKYGERFLKAIQEYCVQHQIGPVAAPMKNKRKRAY